MKEQMNRDIAEYCGWHLRKFYGEDYYISNKQSIVIEKPTSYPVENLRFHASYDWLMPVWQKLRGEFRVFRTNTPITNMKYVQAYDLENSIKEAITEEDTPTTAHKLIHEAITLIKK